MREDILNLAGQIANGVLSSDSSILSRIAALGLHKTIAKVSVAIAMEVIKETENQLNMEEKL